MPHDFPEAIDFLAEAIEELGDCHPNEDAIRSFCQQARQMAGVLDSEERPPPSRFGGLQSALEPKPTSHSSPGLPTPLPTLESYDLSRRRHLGEREGPNGIGCPECGVELHDVNRCLITVRIGADVMPPTTPVRCPHCMFSGARCI